MNLVSVSWSQRRLPEEDAAGQFRRERIKNLRAQWKLWLAFAGLALAAVAFILFFGPLGLLIGGLMLGFIAAISLVGWMLGFSVQAVPYLWGSWGEEDTKSELARLGDEWHVRHGIPNPPYGNWDHVAIGPPGIFMIDSKRLGRSETKLDADGISSGRISFSGGSFRGAAFGLKKALSSHAGRIPDVQAVVAIWGEFAARPEERNRVVYLNAADLVDWLEKQPVMLTQDKPAVIAAALQRL